MFKYIHIELVALLVICLLFHGQEAISAHEEIGDLELIDVFVGNKKDIANSDDPSTNKDFLVVDLKTRRNLFELYSTPSNIWVDFYFCRDPKTVVFYPDRHVFVGELNLSMMNKKGNVSPLLQRRRLTYRVFIPLSTNIDGDLPESFRRDKNQTTYANYDLIRNPSDICIFLLGGNYSGFSFQSNAVVISEEKIVTAIKNRQ